MTILKAFSIIKIPIAVKGSKLICNVSLLVEFMVATCQGMVREKISSRSRNFTASQGKFKSLKGVGEKWNYKSTYLFFSLKFYCFLTFKILLYILRADVEFSRNSILFVCYIKELSIHVHWTWLAESINIWVERMHGH